jgi:hypothetical protein
MRLSRRLLALSLNVLLLHLAWTGSRGECAPAGGHSHDAAAMASMHEAAGATDGAAIAESGSEQHDCSGEMLGASCGEMVGCATVALVGAAPAAAFIGSASAPAIAGDVTGAALAAPRPLPPPPRA